MKPRPYQETGIDFLLSNAPRPHTRLLLDEVGLGKTVQALVALKRLQRRVGVLIVCPTNVLAVWAEIEGPRWYPGARFSRIEDPHLLRWPDPGEIIVTSYSAMQRAMPDRKASVNKGRGALHVFQRDPRCTPILILDEFHRAKSPKTAQGIMLGTIHNRVQARRGMTWLLSATPFPNGPKDVLSLLRRFGLLKRAYKRGETELMPALGATKKRVFQGRQRGMREVWTCDTSKIEVGDVINRLKGFALRRTKHDIGRELPAIDRQVIWLETGRKELKMLRRLDRALERWGALGEDHELELDLLSNLLTVDERDALESVRAELAAAKVPALETLCEDLEANNRKHIVYSHHRAPIEHLASRPGWGVVIGKPHNAAWPCPVGDAAVREFQAGNLQGLAFTGSGREGITLTRATDFTVVSPSWVADHENQAEGRGRWHEPRLGSGKVEPVTIRYLVARHPAEAAVWSALVRKRGFSLRALDGLA